MAKIFEAEEAKNRALAEVKSREIFEIEIACIRLAASWQQLDPERSLAEHLMDVADYLHGNCIQWQAMPDELAALAMPLPRDEDDDLEDVPF